MSARKERIKLRVLISFVLAFLLSLVVYFMFRASYSWVSLILPEFIGISLLGIILTTAFRKRTDLKKFITVLVGVLLMGVIGFVYGRANGIQFLVDLSPELLGSTGLGIVFSLIFKRKFNL